MRLESDLAYANLIRSSPLAGDAFAGGYWSGVGSLHISPLQRTPPFADDFGAFLEDRYLAIARRSALLR
jgi:hypothetical protein